VQLTCDSAALGPPDGLPRLLGVIRLDRRSRPGGRIAALTHSREPHR